MPLFICAWSTMATLGLILEGSTLDPPKELPRWTRVFDLPPSAATFFAFPLLAIPGIAVVVGRARVPETAVIAAVCAALAAYAGAIVVAAAQTWLAVTSSRFRFHLSTNPPGGNDPVAGRYEEASSQPRGLVSAV